MPHAASLRFGDARRISRPALCLVTPGDRERQGNASIDVVDLAARASAAGIDIVQLREPQLSDTALLAIARRVLEAVDRSRTAVLVNDRVDVALAAGADGVHLRADAMRASRVRALTRSGFLIGRSIHSAAEARDAEADGGVDYLIFGTMFPSAGKPADHPVAGLAALADVCAAVRLPVLAIGGISAPRVSEVAAAGAAGVAAIGMFADADRSRPEEMTDRVRRVREAFDTWHRTL
jgi:thiamine-phosphate pyrophosphorylase